MKLPALTAGGGSTISIILAFLLMTLMTLSVWATNEEKRVKFAPGTSEITLQGTLDPSKCRGECFDRFILGAKKGQRMEVYVKSTAPVNVYVWHGDYNNGSVTEGSGQQITLKFKLPSSGDYNVDISPGAANSKELDYQILFVIR